MTSLNGNNTSWPVDRPFIILERIRKVFKTTGGEMVALKDIHTEIYQGEFVSVVGRSGSGKSTLANMITGIDHPTSGTIRVGETVLNGMKESPMSIWRGRNLGIVFQFFQLLPMLSLVENVMLPMDFCNFHDPGEREKRALDLLDLVGLSEHAHQLPSAISGGQQQCTAIARALANDPPILVADEPTGNLDSKTAEVVMNLFEELARQGKTIMMVTHDNSLANRTNRKMVISDGELIPEALSQAFQDLDHTNLLDLSHLAHQLTLQPGQIDFGLPAGSNAVMVTRGALQLVDGRQKETARYEPGQIFASPIPGGSRLLPVDNRPVEMLCFPLDEFLRLSEMERGTLVPARPITSSLLGIFRKGKDKG